MPEVKPNESKSKFMARCVKELMTKEGREKDQSIAICSSTYDKRKR